VIWWKYPCPAYERASFKRAEIKMVLFSASEFWGQLDGHGSKRENGGRHNQKFHQGRRQKIDPVKKG
jgi:hypothetical protein